MDSGLCKYKDSLGKPNIGIHSYRLGGIAIVDYIMTLAVALFTSYLTKIPLNITTVFWLLLAMFLHWLFCVKTSGSNLY